jgi:hypothetical protein
MADTLTASIDLPFAGVFMKGTSQATISDRRVAGMKGFASFAKALANGTGANNARYRFWKQYTTSGGANNDLDLTSLTDDFGVTVTFSLVKWFLLRITSPATGVRLVVGNQGTNTFVGWFGAATHTEEVRDWIAKINQLDGWTVDSTHKALRINNPTGSAITYDLVILGE